jgi:hypothetical protein
MLREMDVINAVCSYLQNLGYVIISKVESVQDHGIVIVAKSPRTKTRISIEAKGQTSSKSETKRYGREFTREQKRDHLGKALLKSCEFIQRNEPVAIALPDDAVDQQLIGSITDAMSRLGITVFFVDNQGKVRVLGKLPSWEQWWISRGEEMQTLKPPTAAITESTLDFGESAEFAKSQNISVNWKRKDTEEYFHLGKKNSKLPNTTPPSG